MIEQKISHLDKNQYFPMKHSKIFLSFSDFLNLQNKYAIQEENIEKKLKKNKNFNKNQTVLFRRLFRN